MLINIDNATNLLDLMREMNAAFSGYLGVGILLMVFIISYVGTTSRVGARRGLVVSLFVSLTTGIMLRLADLLSWNWLIINAVLLAGVIAFMKRGGNE